MTIFLYFSSVSEGINYVIFCGILSAKEENTKHSFYTRHDYNAQTAFSIDLTDKDLVSEWPYYCLLND